MALSRKRAAGLTAALTVSVCMLAAVPALGANQRVVKVQDDCDPVSFAAAGVPCIGDGRTPIGDVVAGAQANDPPPKWRFSRPEFNIDAGGTITAVNEGGETHTFTKVEAFGNGCIDLLNPGGVLGTPAAPCDTIVPIAPGRPFVVSGLQPGISLFQCMIHPWMHSTVEVRARGNRGED